MRVWYWLIVFVVCSCHWIDSALGWVPLSVRNRDVRRPPLINPRLGWVPLTVRNQVVRRPPLINPPACRLQLSLSDSEQTCFFFGDSNEFCIRDSTFGDLGQVAEVITHSFYNVTAPWKQIYQLAELNRLQQSFRGSGAAWDHRMLVVAAAAGTTNGHERTSPSRGQEERIVAFVDLDGRTPNRPTPYKYNPRPYLSDLAVHPDFRRRGIARALVQACEAYCRHDMQKDELYIRVENDNQAAVQMYTRAGYSSIPNPDDPKGRILLLNKKLVQRSKSTRTTTATVAAAAEERQRQAAETQSVSVERVA